MPLLFEYIRRIKLLRKRFGSISSTFLFDCKLLTFLLYFIHFLLKNIPSVLESQSHVAKVSKYQKDARILAENKFKIFGILEFWNSGIQCLNSHSFLTFCSILSFHNKAKALDAVAIIRDGYHCHAKGE